MKIIRWPAVSGALLILLFGFFLIGYVGSPYLRTNLESFATETFESPVIVENLDLNVYHSHVGINGFKIIDPENKSKYLFSANAINFQADISSILKQHLIINYIDAQKLYLRLSQNRSGSFNLVANKDGVYSKESLLFKAQEVINWTSDKVDPIDILASLDVTKNGLKQKKYDPYKVQLDLNQPDFIIKDLTITDGKLTLIPFTEPTPIFFHSLKGQIKNLSSEPKTYAKPIIFKISSAIENDPHSLVKTFGAIDLNGPKINLDVSIDATNINLLTFLPLAKAYTHYIEILNIKSGILSLRGNVKIIDGNIQPSKIYIYLKNLTAKANGEHLNIEALKNLAFSEADLEFVVPINNTPPYFHINEALNDKSFKIKKIKNIEIRLNKNDLLKNFLN